MERWIRNPWVIGLGGCKFPHDYLSGTLCLLVICLSSQYFRRGCLTDDRCLFCLSTCKIAVLKHSSCLLESAIVSIISCHITRMNTCYIITSSLHCYWFFPTSTSKVLVWNTKMCIFLNIFHYHSGISGLKKKTDHFCYYQQIGLIIL